MAQFSSEMRFIEPWSPDRGNPFIRTSPDEGFDYMNFTWHNYPVSITDARPRKDEFDIDTQGFAFFDDPKGSTPAILEILRNNDNENVTSVYYPHIEQMVKERTGASRVVIFDHTIRRRQPELSKTENQTGREQPATMVHCDQSEQGALRRVEQHGGDELSELLKGRIQMINVWRPLRGPVKDWPLAMMDYRSVKAVNQHPTDLWKHQFERRGQTVSFSHADDQKWYYLDGHRTDEVTFIKIWDSKEDVVGKSCPHASFQHPLTPPDTPPRESIEVRCLVFYDPDQ